MNRSVSLKTSHKLVCVFMAVLYFAMIAMTAVSLIESDWIESRVEEKWTGNLRRIVRGKQEWQRMSYSALADMYCFSDERDSYYCSLFKSLNAGGLGYTIVESVNVFALGLVVFVELRQAVISKGENLFVVFLLSLVSLIIHTCGFAIISMNFKIEFRSDCYSNCAERGGILMLIIFALGCIGLIANAGLLISFKHSQHKAQKYMELPQISTIEKIEDRSRKFKKSRTIEFLGIIRGIEPNILIENSEDENKNVSIE